MTVLKLKNNVQAKKYSKKQYMCRILRERIYGRHVIAANIAIFFVVNKIFF